MKRFIIAMALVLSLFTAITAKSETMDLLYQDLNISELTGKITKRAIATGDYIYILAHDEDRVSNPVLIVYNHKTRSLYRTLDLSPCESQYGNYCTLSDIALTTDGVLVGCSANSVLYANRATDASVIFYKWNSDSNGIATGSPTRWNTSYQEANYTTSICGDSMAWEGSSTDGYIYYTCYNADQTDIRSARVKLVSGKLDGGYFNLINKTSSTSKYLIADNIGKPVSLLPSLTSGRFIINGTACEPAEVTFEEESRGNSAVGDKLSGYNTGYSHKAIFAHNGSSYLVAPTSTGVKLAKLSTTFASSTDVTVSATDLSSTSSSNVAATGASVYDSGVWKMALFVIRDGKISKYITHYDPEISVSPSEVSISAPHNGTSPVEKVTVTGKHLTSPLTIGTNADKIKYEKGSDWDDYTGGTLNISIGTNYEPATYTGGYVYVSSTGASQKTIAVTATVTAVSSLSVNPTSLSFEMTEGDTPVAQTVNVVGVDLKNISFNSNTSRIEVTAGDDWSTTTGGTLIVKPKAGLSAGTYSGDSYFFAVGSGSTTYKVYVDITVNAKSATYSGNRANFAYGLTASGDKTAGYDLTYKLTDAVKSATVVLTEKTSGATKSFTGGTAKGSNSIHIKPADLAEFGEYNWRVDVASYPIVGNGGEFFNYLISAPYGKYGTRGGVGVVTNPESDAYGRVVESVGCAGGFNLFEPDLTLVGNYCAGTSPWDATNISDTYRIGMRDGSVAYAAAWSDTGAGFYAFNPEHPEYGTSNFCGGTNDGTGTFLTGSTITGTGAPCAAFSGSGDATRFWTFAEDWYGSDGEKYKYGILCRWDIGSATTINKGVAAAYGQYTGTSYFLTGNMEIVPYGEGVFLSQNRAVGQHSTSVPGFMYIDIYGNCYYNSGDHIDDIPSTGSGLAISPDGKTLVVSGGNNNLMRVYDVSWDGMTPTLSLRNEIDGSANSGNEVSQLAFDPAGNILAFYRSTSASYDGLHAFALPNDNPTASTPAKAASIIYGPEATVPAAAKGVELNLSQVKDGDKYTFNLQMDLAVPSACLTRQVGTGATVASKMAYYVLAVDETTYEQLSKATSVEIDGVATTPQFVDVTSAVDMGNGLAINPNTYSYYWRVPVGSGSGDTKKLSIIWHNVVPNRSTGNILKKTGTSAPLVNTTGRAYLFDTYLVPDDDYLDKWSRANLTDNSSAVDILAPTAALHISELKLVKVDATYADTDDNSWQPDGAVIDVYEDGAKTGTRAVHPVKFSGLNAVEAECSADALPVSQEVLDNNTITYQLGVVKSGSSVTYGDDNLYKPTAAEVKTILSGGKVTVAVPYDSDLATGAAYNAYLFTAYTSSRYPDGTLIDIDNTSDQGNEYVLTLTAPTVNLVDRPAFAKYEDRFWDGETTSSLGYFAHIAAQFEISGLPSDLNCYVGFNAQQKACYEDNIGCYPTNNADTDGFTMWRHSFAGTSAANGGAPLNFQFGNGSGAIAPIADYTEFETVDGQAWTATYDDAVNNWSRLAAETGRLAIHVNPAYRYASESAFLQDGALSGKIDVKVKVYVPLDETRRYTIAGKTGSNAPRRASGTAALVIPELTAAADVEQIDLSEAGLVTGIGQVTADDTATAVYYNLQGIRVNNPVAGQFYIEVCGRRATKILYR